MCVSPTDFSCFSLRPGKKRFFSCLSLISIVNSRYTAILHSVRHGHMPSRRIALFLIGLFVNLIGSRGYITKTTISGWSRSNRAYFAQTRNDEISVLITGCTGSLGTNLHKRLKAFTSQVYGTFRSHQKLAQIFPSDHSFFLHMDLLKMEIIDNLPHHLPQASRRILINNAGVCLEGSTREALRKSLQVNFFAPISLIERSLSHPHPSTDIINVSSGDGEQQFLNSDIVSGLNVCSSIEDLKAYAGRLIESFDDSLEYAHGLTPMYSLSKAFLNKATKLIHHDLEIRGESQQRRIVAVCPGNFLSVMTSEDELTDSEQVAFMLPVEEAVERMFPVILNYNKKYPGGYFYRYGERIDW